MKTSEIDQAVKLADPLPSGSAELWASSEAAASILESIAVQPAALVGRTVSPGRRLVRRRFAVPILVAGLVLVGGGIAAATAVLLGAPAPEHVKEDIAAVDAGLPADLRLNPDVATAKSVASTGTSTLYYAALKDGGFCTEIVTAGEVGRGAVCTTGAQVSRRDIEVTVPFTDPITPSSAVTVGGRVNVPSSSLVIRYGDGQEEPIPMGEDGFFIFDVPVSRLALIHANAFELVALAGDGSQVAKAEVPAVEAEEGSDADQPIFVNTTSTGADLTKVLAIEGSVNVKGAATLELRYPDGTTVDLPLAANGTYYVEIPKDRQGDLYEAPGTLTARDATGRTLATAPVASVAWWERHARAPSG